MSVEAITWALSLKVDRSSAKFVLVAMANCANVEMLCWPSIQYLSDATSQDRKTVMENIKRLKDFDLIIDTGERRGGTGQVPVFRLNMSKIGTVKQSRKRHSSTDETVPKSDNNSTVFPSEPVDNSSQQYQNRDSTEKETVPKTDGNSTVFPDEQYRFSAETVPKTGHGTVKEPLMNPKETGAAALSPDLPEFVPKVTWQNYLEMRRANKNMPTKAACALIIDKLRGFHQAGYDIKAILENSTVGGWADVYPPKSDQQARASPSVKPVLPVEEYSPGLKAKRGGRPDDFSDVKSQMRKNAQLKKNGGME